MPFCVKCGRHHFVFETHTCPPPWNVWCPEDGEGPEDGRKVYASDAEEAAEKWAEIDDCESAEYRIVGGSEIIVHVVDNNGVITVWAVRGESVPSYSATEVEPDD